MRSRQPRRSSSSASSSLHRQADQVVEIDRVERGQARLVARVQHGRLHLARALRGGERFLRRQPGVLRARDQVARVVEHVGLAARRQQVLDLRAGVVAVEHREAAAQAGLGVLDLQELQPQRVEGADGQPFGRIALDALGDALAHFLRGLVGEGDRGDALGRHAPRRDQVRDLLDDDAGLAAAGAGEHEQGAVGVQDGGALGGIERVHADNRSWPRILPGSPRGVCRSVSRLQRRGRLKPRGRAASCLRLTRIHIAGNRDDS